MKHHSKLQWKFKNKAETGRKPQTDNRASEGIVFQNQTMPSDVPVVRAIHPGIERTH